MVSRQLEAPLRVGGQRLLARANAWVFHHTLTFPGWYLSSKPWSPEVCFGFPSVILSVIPTSGYLSLTPKGEGNDGSSLTFSFNFYHTMSLCP
jgi:hypothetical protein